ncbi:MAG: sigma-70 family RNA polymerase sigma factor [Candidatus Poribacteria bacterium]|nr:sigma-70 family RNA polymerase sigma factor [Candidatus Poribacteria bacterium]
MKTADIELINRTLNGDDTAFTELVEKYQKPVHALVWRKIGDFHIAEEITQDTFLQVYRGLAKLKKPQSFASWLYVIAANNCSTWLRKKRVWTLPLEDISTSPFTKSTYSQYVITEKEQTAAEAQRDAVKKLLEKLPESERTVITLHYFSEMSSAEIGAFLGVSANTIRSRLRRAQQRLKKEETMIREALEHFQITPNLTDDIMREIARLKPNTPTGGKPLVPWVIAATSAVFILLLLGLGSQHLLHFQKSYSLDAQAETTVELVDTPIVLNIEPKSDVRNQFGNENVFGKSDNNGQQVDEILLAAAEVEGEDLSIPKQQWIQSEPIKGSPVESIHVTTEGELYALDFDFGLHKLPADKKEWQHLIDLSSLDTRWVPNPPITKWNNTLYILSSNQLFASKDDGKTWDLVHSWQEEYGPRGLILMDDAFHIAFVTGVFRSEDKGKTWEKMNTESMGNIHFFVKNQNTLIAGADKGLFKLNDNNWEQIALPEENIDRIFSVTATNKYLYFAAEFNLERAHHVFAGQEPGWWIFRSTDIGESWKDITPTNAWNRDDFAPNIALIAIEETLLVIADVTLRSTDRGETWMSPQELGTSTSEISQCRAVALNEKDLYINSEDGLHRSIDKGQSWDLVKIPQAKESSPIETIITFNGNDKRQNTDTVIYARLNGALGYGRGEIAKTTDKGRSWKIIQMEIPETERHEKGQPSISQIVKSENVIYAKGVESGGYKINLYNISTDSNKLVQVQDAPIPDSSILKMHYLYPRQEPVPIEYKKSVEENTFGAAQFFKQLEQLEVQHENKNFFRSTTSHLFDLGFSGPFAVSGETFYMEYNFKLFRWKQRDIKWHDTGLEETVELTKDIARKNLKLAVSGNTVYVGKRDGHLVVSYDRGNSWTDLTQGLPFQVKTFNNIIVAETTVFVSTDRGIITTDDGRSWRTITDANGNNLIMEHLAVDGTTLYGVTKDTGIHRIESGTWEQFVSDIPDSVTSLAVDRNTLFVGTKNNKVFHYNLDN